MKLERRYFMLMILTAAIVAIDQATKIYIHTQFQLGESLPVIQNFFNITYVRNTGAAFGIFQTSTADLQFFGLFTLSVEFLDMARKIFFGIMPPLAMLIIFFILKSVPNKDTLQITALSGIFGGALGNYIDRLRFGFVVDFLDVHIKNVYTWPAFNVADSTIVCGSVALGYIIFLQWQEERKGLAKGASN